MRLERKRVSGEMYDLELSSTDNEPQKIEKAAYFYFESTTQLLGKPALRFSYCESG